MHPKKTAQPETLGEHRLIFFGGNPESSSRAESAEGEVKTEAVKPLEPARKEQLDKDVQRRVEVRKQHEQVEEKERNETLSAIEKEMEALDAEENEDEEKEENDASENDENNAQEPAEQNEAQLKDAEKFMSESRDTLKDPYQKEVFDAAINALSSQEKVAYYRDMLVWFNSCDKQNSASSTLTPADIQEVNKRVFAIDIVFAAFDYNVQMPSGLRQTRNASKADYLLNVSEADRQLAEQASKKMEEATKKYMKAHPDVARILERQHKDFEQRINESLSNESDWDKDGKYGRYNKSPEEMKKDAAKELQSIVDQINGKKGIKFELQPASQQDRETGERLSVHIVPKDQHQSGQVQEVTKKVVGSFEKKKEGFVRQTETLIVTSDAQKLKECIAAVATHNYSEKKATA